MSGPYWTDTFNPVMGCTECSPGCANCWARQMHERFHADPFSHVHTLPSVLSKPLRRRKPTTYFVCNTSDLFHPSVPFEFIAAVYGVMAATPQHTYLVLTKRPERRAEFMRWIAPLGKERECCWQATAKLDRSVDDPLPVVDAWPLPNVWEGVTAEDQQRADERIPVLLDTPAAHRWVSAEPLLGAIDMWAFLKSDLRDRSLAALKGPPMPGLDQIIIGGESGKGARPCDVQWIRDIVRKCREAGVKCFVKQLGSQAFDQTYWANGVFAGGVRHVVTGAGSDPSEWPEDLRVRELGWTS